MFCSTDSAETRFFRFGTRQSPDAAAEIWFEINQLSKVTVSRPSLQAIDSIGVVNVCE
jgi:hypothetical protein